MEADTNACCDSCEHLRNDCKRQNLRLIARAQECEKLRARIQECETKLAKLRTVQFAFAVRCKALANERRRFAETTRSLLATCASLLILADPDGEEQSGIAEEDDQAV